MSSRVAMFAHVCSGALESLDARWQALPLQNVDSACSTEKSCVPPVSCRQQFSRHPRMLYAACVARARHRFTCPCLVLLPCPKRCLSCCVVLYLSTQSIHQHSLRLRFGFQVQYVRHDERQPLIFNGAELSDLFVPLRVRVAHRNMSGALAAMSDLSCC